MKSKILAREKVGANCLKELKKGDCAGDISIHPGFKSNRLHLKPEGFCYVFLKISKRKTKDRNIIEKNNSGFLKKHNCF
jgi:hypothetical protein